MTCFSRLDHSWHLLLSVQPFRWVSWSKWKWKSEIRCISEEDEKKEEETNGERESKESKERKKMPTILNCWPIFVCLSECTFTKLTHSLSRSLNFSLHRSYHHILPILWLIVPLGPLTGWKSSGYGGLRRIPFNWFYHAYNYPGLEQVKKVILSSFILY